VAYETSARDSAVAQQIWVQDGAIEVTVGKVTHTLGQGRLPRHAARCPGDLPQPHAQGRALHRGVELMMPRIRQLESIGPRVRRPLRRAHRLRRRRRLGEFHVADDARQGRALLAGVAAAWPAANAPWSWREDSRGEIMGTAQAVWAPPRTSRIARIFQDVVSRMPGRHGVGARVLAAAERAALAPAARCWCSTPRSPEAERM
jgi:hypothetical protein